jgi:excinuclease ABC subunit C
MEETPEHLKKLITSLPDKPGVYQYLSKEGTVIYVGKAKNLKKRVTSYFSSRQHPARIQVLVKNIQNINYLVVDTEYDALLLENNLIKEHQPRYNVQLKDDKTYPWICLKSERFPRVFPTRNIIRDGSQYFGPYASVKMMHALLELVRKLFPLRNCNYVLSDENIQKGKFRVCLEYHIGNCKGPCTALQTEEEYNENIAQIKQILRGNSSTVLRHLKALMDESAVNMQFEKAHLIKEKISLLERFQTKSTVVSPSITQVDVFTIISDDKAGFVNFLRVINGAIVQGHTLELKKKLEENDIELLQLAITEIRQRFGEETKEIVTPFDPDMRIPGIEFIVPARGEKKHLLDLSLRNVEQYRADKEKAEEKTNPEARVQRVMKTMAKDLRLSEEPRHMECFDNSNFQGTNPVSACVVFRDGKPSKKEYRHFNIRTVEGPDDFASMEEVIHRRYKRMMDEASTLPQLIVIDGGKGQLSAAMASLERLGLSGKVAVIGIAKRLEEIYYPNDPIPLYLDKKSETLRIIQHMRDEAHRFGITHHRKRRSKATIKSELTEIQGVSHKTTQKLLSHFRSVKRIKEASLEELAEVIGKSKGKIVHEFFNKTV